MPHKFIPLPLIPLPLIRLAILAAVLALATPSAAQDFATRADEIVGTYHDYGLFNGSVLVADAGVVVYERGFGEANMAWHIPNTPSTKFRVGSITKQFTAALVMQLVEQGLIDLDAPITTYVPDYPARNGNRITTHHLLTHTSGTPNYTSLPGFMQDETRNPYQPESFLAVFSGLDLEFEPGTEFRYSNSGYFLLGVIIEHVTGERYADVLRERLLDPLGLVDTGYDSVTGIVEEFATGYVVSRMDYRHAPYLDASVPYAAGMMYSTVRDLHRWIEALYRGDPFESRETLERMLTPVFDGYAYGIGVSRRAMGPDSVLTIAHGGGIFGFSAMLMHMPEQGRTVVVLDNASGNSGAVADALAAALYDQPVDLPLQPISRVMARIIEAQGVDAAIRRYRALRTDSADAFDFGESQLNTLGYHYLGRTATAIAVFKLNVEQHPSTWNWHDSLGEAYLQAGDREQAIANYEKALELNPESEGLKEVLRRITDGRR